MMKKIKEELSSGMIWLSIYIDKYTRRVYNKINEILLIKLIIIAYFKYIKTIV